MKWIVPLTLVVAGCATTPAGLGATDVKATVSSQKSANEFAVCVAETLAGETQLRSNGDHYWVLREVMGVPRHRWDFHSTDNGSIAELRSTGAAGSGQDRVETCAAI